MEGKGTYRWEDFGTPNERIPTYEESMATAPVSTSTSKPWQNSSSSGPSIIRQERTRRVRHLITNSITPTFTFHLANGCSHLSIIILPSESLRNSKALTEQNIVTPSPQSQETRTLLALNGEENRASFWMQGAVVQELDCLLRRELSDEAATAVTSNPDSRPEAQPLHATELPPRPKSKWWLKRAFVLPGPDHDPTGETGKWNLGWRTPETLGAPNIGPGCESSSWKPRARTKELQPDEMAISTTLQPVSFRTESEMGLLETTTVKCIWVEIEIGI
ncbi:hypothetical protein PV05_09780 [Exophiala xenobiotica]|uniref:Uncharacterized protein n=1 Tax=Exophiala xenobiotica TaxID=348802 RepID=A0A0D2BFU1_9EURO|nr:uncharacterized protein PV05_09780 [Exophiala xenobiotica]KIW51021.1 hypothetical protein PV05_09780 [Exophiala xenobiotica]